MAVDRSLDALFTGVANDAANPVTNLYIPIASLSGLTVANATASAGDWPSAMLAICQTGLDHYNGLATADRPAAVRISATTAPSSSVGPFAGYSKTTFQLEFYIQQPAPTGVVAEPA